MAGKSDGILEENFWHRQKQTASLSWRVPWIASRSLWPESITEVCYRFKINSTDSNVQID